MRTWTFCGHWNCSRLIIDYVLDGEVQDTRLSNDRTYPEGLWAASASADTIEEALQTLIDEYEPEYEDDPDDVADRSQAADLLRGI